jgi:site-specific recombinase XerD
MRSVPLETIGGLLGHKDPKMTKWYAHLSPTTLQQAVMTLHHLHSENNLGTQTGEETRN